MNFSKPFFFLYASFLPATSIFGAEFQKYDSETLDEESYFEELEKKMEGMELKDQNQLLFKELIRNSIRAQKQQNKLVKKVDELEKSNLKLKKKNDELTAEKTRLIEENEEYRSKNINLQYDLDAMTQRVNDHSSIAPFVGGVAVGGACVLGGAGLFCLLK